jgi:hypothetical protein
MDTDRRPWLSPHLILGLAVATLGVLFLLDNLGLIEVERYLEFWPVVLIVVGVIKFVQATTGAGYAGAVLWMLVGGWILAYNLSLVPIDFWDFWPLLLVAAGGWLVWRGVSGGAPARSAADSNDTISGVAVMAGIERRSNAADFRGGDLTAVMGGCEIDLRAASMTSGDAVLEVFALWGGIEIRVPEDWTVIGKVVPLMGAFEDTTRPPREANRRLIVKGLALMGGVEVRN